MNKFVDPASWWRDTDKLVDDMDCRAAEDNLYEFLRQSWSSFDPAPFVDTYVLQAIAEHLEAIALGHISRLVINVPPRTSKTSMTNVAFPAWIWAQPERRWSHWMGPKVQFLTASYSSNLILRDANRCRRLISSQWYQRNWGDRFQLTKDQNAKGRFDNSLGGTRFSTSVGATLTGEGGNIIILDDPNNAQDANSDVILESTRDWFDQALSTRFNNPSLGALIVIQQRLNEGDITGHILSKDQGDYVHLMLPMRFEKDRAHVLYPNEVGFTDWRKEEGELLTPERMDEKAVARLETTLGPYGTAGQLQQRPSPKGGGIIKREFWREFTDSDYPESDITVASLDTAFTEDKENDPSAMTIWMSYKGDGLGQRALLGYAWSEHLEFNKLLEKVIADCRKYHVNVLLVENKASGPSLAQELRRRFMHENFTVYLIDPKGKDKVHRAHAVVPTFASGLVYAPDRSWADKVIDQCESFPKGRHDDLVDSCTMALDWLRKTGNLSSIEDESAEIADSMRLESPKANAPLYPGA